MYPHMMSIPAQCDGCGQSSNAPSNNDNIQHHTCQNSLPSLLCVQFAKESAPT